MITFPDSPEVEPFKDDSQVDDTIYVQLDDYSYMTFAGQTITIPKGEKTDGGSIPYLGRVLTGLTPDGYERAAWDIHDHLYLTNGENGRFTRIDADKILLEIMTRLGVPWYQRLPVYHAVRIFGGSHFNKGK